MRKKTPTCKGQQCRCSQSAEGESAIHLNHTLATDVVPHFNFKLAFNELLSIPCIVALSRVTYVSASRGPANLSGCSACRSVM